MKCLVTGFEAFEGVTRNPTKEIVERLPELMEGVALLTRVLPVEYGVVDRIISPELFGEVDAVFMLGAAGEAEFGRVEAQAFNVCDSLVADNLGRVETQSVIEPAHSKETVIKSTINLDGLLLAAQASPMPWRRSEDPGRFVCNDSYFRMLHRASHRPSSCPTLFVHIPVPERKDSVWAFEAIEASVHLLLRAFLTLTRA